MKKHKKLIFAKPFKAVVSVFVLLALLVSLLSGCGNKRYYLPLSESHCTKDGTAYRYTYNYDGTRLLGYTFEHLLFPELDYKVSYIYQDNVLVSLTKIDSYEKAVQYTAEKLSKNKYRFTNAQSGEAFVEGYDEYGRIMLKKNADGSAESTVYTYDKKGRPTKVAHTIVHPSGSNRTFNYNVEFILGDKYRLREEGSTDYIEISYKTISR